MSLINWRWYCSYLSSWNFCKNISSSEEVVFSRFSSVISYLTKIAFMRPAQVSLTWSWNSSKSVWILRKKFVCGRCCIHVQNRIMLSSCRSCSGNRPVFPYTARVGVDWETPNVFFFQVLQLRCLRCLYGHFWHQVSLAYSITGRISWSNTLKCRYNGSSPCIACLIYICKYYLL